MTFDIFHLAFLWEASTHTDRHFITPLSSMPGAYSLDLEEQAASFVPESSHLALPRPADIDVTWEVFQAFQSSPSPDRPIFPENQIGGVIDITAMWCAWSRFK